MTVKSINRVVLGSVLGLLIAAPVFASGAGEDTYNKVCKTCHGPGVMGAPKLGDKADWAARAGQGMATLEDHAIKGFKGAKGFMPPKGGRSSLTDDEVKAAVAYMVNNSK
ncbi:MAG: c-type cytochrome [Gammaproteobacteria bacterium]|nr:c-type cytochrome [Gammaproteobacteria bacterium]